MKYRVLKDVPEHNWLTGEIVSIIGKVSDKHGALEEVSEDTPHQHFMAIVDPVLLHNKVNNG